MKSLIFNKIGNTSISNHKMSVALLLFRVFVAFSLMGTHGIKKVTDIEETMAHIPDPFGLGASFSAYFAIFANVICPLFIVVGGLTRLAILPILSITLMGFFVVHFNDPWVVKDVPLMYSLAFLLLLYLGPGNYSIDYIFSNNQRQ